MTHTFRPSMLLVALALFSLLPASVQARPTHRDQVRTASAPTWRVLPEADAAERIVLEEGVATFVLPSGLRFYPRSDLVRLRPEFQETSILGAVLPADRTLSSGDGWFLPIWIEETGHVPMTALPDAPKLLERMRATTADASAQREGSGEPPIAFIDWVRPPHLDKRLHTLTWVDEIQEGEDPEPVIRLNAHVFGRSQTLVLYCNASRDESVQALAAMDALIASIAFAEGAAYEDYRVSDGTTWSMAPVDLIAAPTDEAEADIESQLNFQQGRVTLGDGLATMEVPDAYRYLDPEDSRRVLVDVWGNPPAAADGVLGMVFPAGASVFADGGWGVVVTFEEVGHVEDSNAEAIDYDALLEEMKADVAARNKERTEGGYETVELVGWPRPPTYDPEGHALIWAKELKFSDNPDASILNYDLRLLGRKGVLSLKAVAPMDEVSNVRAGMQAVKGFTQFNKGHRYDDFIPGVDEISDAGLAALVLGGTAAAAKSGVFKSLFLALLAAKKFVVIGLVGAWAAIKQWLAQRKRRREGRIHVGDQSIESE